MSIADKIQRLQAARTSIANAITAKGGTVQSGDGFEDFSTCIATIPSGITPTGNIDITSTQQTDVTNYATAQVVDADLVAGNIKKDVDVLGVVGTYEGGGSVEYETYIATSEITKIIGLVQIIESVFDTSGSCFITLERIPQEFHAWKSDLVMYRRSYVNGTASGGGTGINYLTNTSTSVATSAATPGYESSDPTHVYVGETLILRKHGF